MKKILFALYYMNVGGVEKAFLGLLDKLPREGLEVHVALMAPEGGFMGYLPDWVTVHTIEPFYRNINFLKSPAATLRRQLLHGNLSGLPLAREFVKSRIKGTKDSLIRYLLRDDDALGGTVFDLAVSYASPHEYLDYYITRHIKARHRATWIHFDVTKAFNSTESVLKSMSTVDRIFVVSDRGRELFNSKFPTLASKTTTFHNIISPELILNDAARPSAFNYVKGAVNIVTVGRLNPEKGQNLAIAALCQLRSRGVNAVLHLVGSGRTDYQLRRQALESGLDDYVRFYGSQPNPYPYMAGADIYLQPSLHEGYCITLAEAKVFGAPIVATDFTGAREQLASRSNAVIAADFTPEAIADALRQASTMPRTDGVTDAPNDIDKLLSLLHD